MIGAPGDAKQTPLDRARGPRPARRCQAQRVAWGYGLAGLLTLGCSRPPTSADAGTEAGPAPIGGDEGFEGSGEVGSADAGPGSETSDEESGASEATEETAAPCFESEYSFVPPHPNVVLALDNSASMLIVYNHDGDPQTPEVTRWQALHEALTAILGDYQERIDFGAKVFPTGVGCSMPEGVDVPCAPDNAGNILAQIPPADGGNPSGLTPSGTALVQTLAYLEGLDATLPRAMIFMADGSTSVGCEAPNNEAAIVPILAEAYNAGQSPSIRTFVVGIAAAGETAEQLDAFARAGGSNAPAGQPAFFDAQDRSGLEDALDSILSEVVSCTVPLESEPPTPTGIEVEVDGALYGWVDAAQPGFDCETDDGWRPLGPLEIELCGEACERFRSLEVPAATLYFYCE